jgi:Concanavalin A-like lectin/glucanases superfamily
VRGIGLAFLVGCYAPHVESGVPCDPGPCPVGQVCSPFSHTCGTGDVAPVDAGGSWLTGYAHRKRITVTPEIEEALVDFSLSVVIAGDPDLAAGARADGTDIVFTGDDGATHLDAELVAYDSGALEAWVRTTMAPHAATALFMYYGGPSGASSAWPAGFTGVWHMTTGDDSSGHGYTASASTSTQQPATAVGIIGGAVSYDGVDDRLAIGDPSDGSLDFGTRSFSYSMWVNVTTSVGPYDVPFHKGGSSLSELGYDIELGTGPWHACLSDGASVPCATFGNETAFLGRWVHLTAVVDRAAGKLNVFADRALAESVDISSLGSIDTTYALTFGVGGDPFHGVLDEVRVCSAPLSPSWIAAEYDNAMSRNAFIAIGNAESP